jgi:hypothetical protein
VIAEIAGRLHFNIYGKIPLELNMFQRDFDLSLSKTVCHVISAHGAGSPILLFPF